MFAQDEIEGFFEAVESLKKYRRSDIKDEAGKDLLEKLYVDLLPNQHILNKTLLQHTTFLIGRKGTGKSTIFLRLEQELHKKKGYLSCYIDTKSMFEQSQSNYEVSDYVKDYIPPSLLEKYFIERTFIKNMLTILLKQIEKKYDRITQRIIDKLVKTKREEVREKLRVLLERVQNNDLLKEIELPILSRYENKTTSKESETRHEENQLGIPEIDVSTEKVKFNSNVKHQSDCKELKESEVEKSFSEIFLKVFQVKDVITDIKEILSAIGIEHLYILLDDFSEVDDDSLMRFVDVVLAPLNNWSEEFIKFKIAAYPGRIYYGRIDPGKVDIIHLDFYNLYSEFGRNKMEENAVDFTERLLSSRLEHFTSNSAERYFDTSSGSIEEYYELLFQSSMNVPRILGYILSYCYQSKLIYRKKISKRDIESASEKYFEDKVLPFFGTTTYSLVSMQEKISTLQLKELLELIVQKLSDIKKRISTLELKGRIYNQKHPYASHFHFDPRLEDFLKTLELNFFISKYSDLSDKDGSQVSIYNINHGLAVKNNLLWGKPKGSEYRKYFIERPFAFTRYINHFLNDTKKIYCTNQSCDSCFSMDDLKFLEFTGFKCNKCNSTVIIEPVSEYIKEVVENIEESKLLPLPQLKILSTLAKSEGPLYAREIAQEIDYSGQLVGRRGKKLDVEQGFVERSRENESDYYQYRITDAGAEYYSDIDAYS